MPVYEKLLLVLPAKELYDYVCKGCLNSLGAREVTAADKLVEQKLAAGKGRPQVRLL